MPKLKKSNLIQNLAKYQVWIEDTDPNSRYFRLSQVPEILTGGKNAFLIAGSPELIATTEVKIEIIDSNGNTVFVQPIKNYAEGLSRVVSIEVYDDTPAGPATLTILGQLRRDAKGNEPPVEFANAYNVRWQKQITIVPSQPNTTPIRLYQRPELDVYELLVPHRNVVSGPTLTLTTGSVSLAAVTPPKATPNNKPSVVVYANGFTFNRNMLGGIFATMVEGVPISASIAQIYNETTLKLSGTFSEYIPVGFQTADYSIEYTGEPTYTLTDLSRSFAEIYLTKLTTFSGDIVRAKISMRSLDQPGDYQQIADIRLEANELTVTQSNMGQQDVKMGYFNDQSTIDSFWSAGVIENNIYLTGSVLELAFDSQYLLDSAHITNLPSTSYPATPVAFIGLVPELEFVGGLEYTFSSSLFVRQPDITKDAVMDVYLVGTAFPSTSTSPLGTKIASFGVPVRNGGKRFEDVAVNFTAEFDGTAHLRFVISSGEWYISNVSVVSARETGFNPDEVRVLAPIFGRRYEQLQFKAELYDVNNNLVPVIIESHPRLFDGGNYVFRGTDHRLEGDISILPSGSDPATAIKLKATGFMKGVEFVSGSAIVLGHGAFYNQNTPFLVGSSVDGKPYFSVSDKMRGYVDEATGRFVLDIEGDILVGSGSSKFDIRSLLPRNNSTPVFDRMISTIAEADYIWGYKAVTAGTWDKQFARMGRYTRGSGGFELQAPVTHSAVSSSYNPYITGSYNILLSGTIDVPADKMFYNDTIFGDFNVNLISSNIEGGVYMLNYQLSVASNWQEFPTTASVAQVLVKGSNVFVTQEGSYSPDPLIKYPIPVAQNRNGSTTLYYLVRLVITTEPSV
jgi:hypothetical protein